MRVSRARLLLVLAALSAGCVDLTRPTGAQPCAVTRECPATHYCDVDAGTCAPRSQQICPAQLNFEDGTTESFAPAECCRLAIGALSQVTSPASCGLGALRLLADFASTSAEAGQGEARAELTPPLDLFGKTVTADVMLEAPGPGVDVAARLFVAADPSDPVEGPSELLVAGRYRRLTVVVPLRSDVSTVGVIVFPVAPVDARAVLYLDEVGWQ